LGRARLALGQLDEAERSLRENLAFAREMGGRAGIATGLYSAGLAFVWLGKLNEAHSMLEENLAIVDDLGIRLYIANVNVALGYAKMHLGQYERARAHMQTGLACLREYGEPQWAIGLSLFALGSVALAGEAHAEAWQLLEECVAVFRQIGRQDEMGRALAALGYAARGLGQLPQARQHLCEALQTVADIGAFIPFVLALPAVALLLADRGEVERAVELHGLASRYPLVANSCWFEDVAGKHIAAVAATLPPKVVAAAQEPGQARDLNATVAELLVQLGE
jgi:tetratricopeptide (TPR) repeat protein